MRNIVKDIEKNCPECHCNTEETIKFLAEHGDFSYTSDHYRAVWFFYKDLLTKFNGECFKKRKARTTTNQLFRISNDKFRLIRKWANKHKM